MYNFYFEMYHAFILDLKTIDKQQLAKSLRID